MIPVASGSLIPEPPYQHGSVEKIGVLVVNLGTPEHPTANALKIYLKEFLSDPRVVEIPRLLWWPILNLIILNFRPKRSAEKYASIWLKNGSPLRVNSERQVQKVKEEFTSKGININILLAMRYGKPSIEESIQKLKKQNINKLLLLPLYPQFSASTSATVFDKVFEQLIKMRNPPAIRTVKCFHDNEYYISNISKSIKNYWSLNGKPEVLVFSFHGIPLRSLMKGDPYHCQCHKTARLIAEELNLKDSEWQISFQSRFGKAEWLKPYTSEIIVNMAKKGIKSINVVCPGFISDCLETLEEIEMELKEEFLNAGGSNFNYIPCLNDTELGVSMLCKLIEKETLGWRKEDRNDKLLTQLAKNQRKRALDLGAEN
jgi:ferrochelatase